MNNKNLFWAGAGLGIVAGLFLNSDKGIQMRENTADYLKNQKDLINEKSSAMVQKATEVVSELKEKGNQYLKNANVEAVNTDDVQNYIDEKVSEFKNTVLSEINKTQRTNGRSVKA